VKDASNSSELSEPVETCQTDTDRLDLGLSDSKDMNVVTRRDIVLTELQRRTVVAQHSCGIFPAGLEQFRLIGVQRPSSG